MRWESVHVNARARDVPEGKKLPGRTGGIWGPGRRWGHTLNSVKNGRLIYVFGGFYGSEKCHSNEVFVFDTVKRTWSKPMMKGVPPSPRDSHSCTTVGSKLYVFGGTDGITPLKDLHILDTSSNTWILPSVQGNGPDAREGHSAALVGRRLFIFGGCGKSADDSGGELYYNDLYILDTEKLVWEKAVTSGNPPSARDSHTCSAWKNRIIVLGGEDSSDCYLSDVHILDTDSLSWSQINTSGYMLAPRAGHTTVALGSYLYVFGGFRDDRNLYDDLHMLNLGTGTWSRMLHMYGGPSARFSVAGDCLDEQEGILVFMGGCNQFLEALDDMYYLYTDMPVMNGQFERRHERFSIKKELKRKCQEEYLPVVRNDKKNDAPKLGIMLNPPQTVHLQGYHHVDPRYEHDEEKIFEARITNINQYGYAIESLIDGELLHGVLFSCTAGYVEDNHPQPTNVRRETGIEVESADLNECPPDPNAVAEIHQETAGLEQGQCNKTNDNESTLHGPYTKVSDDTEQLVSGFDRASDGSCGQSAGIQCEDPSLEVEE